ncbi:MAG: GntR family transcriptional regulator [Eubacterium sp.]|nr:GntR family transcriptional regulator [Eubacterium sp.]
MEKMNKISNPSSSDQISDKANANKSQQAYDTIRHFIMSGIFAPGTRLSERSLQAELNISRTPIKAALEKLTFEGYLESSEDKVAIVSKIGFPEALEIYELRSVIESLSAELAASRRSEEDLVDLDVCITEHRNCLTESIEAAEKYDAEFHMLIARASRNTQISRHLKPLIDHCQRVSVYHNQKNSNRVIRSLEQHEAILQAIRAQNAEEAHAAMTIHMEDVIAMTKNLMAEYYFMYK